MEGQVQTPGRTLGLPSTMNTASHAQMLGERKLC